MRVFNSRVHAMDESRMKALLKRWWFGLRGKDPEAIVVSFRSGDPALADAMCEEIRTLEPGRRHVTISAGESWTEVRRKLRPYRIGLAPVLMDGDRKYNALRSRAFFLAP